MAVACYCALNLRMLRTSTEFALCMHLLDFQVPSDEKVRRRERREAKRGGERKEARLEVSHHEEINTFAEKYTCDLYWVASPSPSL